MHKHGGELEIYAGESESGDGAVPNGDPTYVMTKEHAAAFKKVGLSGSSPSQQTCSRDEACARTGP
jgi:hypothetical protein